MSNQLPEGYKQTEIGVIPEDWEIDELGNIGKFKNGINKGSEDFGHGLPFVNLMDVFGISSISKIEHLGLVNSNEAERKAYDLKEGDVLFIRSSVKPSGVGLTTIVTKNLPNTVYSGFLIRFRDDRKLETNFKKYCFSEEKFRQNVIANSTVSANTNINQDNLKKLNLAYPKSFEEQRSLSQALSDVDALIFALDKLIAKKRDLKTATMQQLLTGKKRLPGFGEGQGYKESAIGLIPEDWDCKKIGEFTDCTAGGTPSTLIDSYWGGNIKWMSSGELHQKVVRDVEGRITEKGLNNSSTKVVPPNCVLIGLAGQGKTRGTVAINEVELCTNQSIAAIYPSRYFDSKYLLYNLDDRYEELRGLSTGDGGRGGLNLRIIRSILLPFPTIEEQRAIATVLSDMDNAISALESRQAKTKAIKQGMMQELLTGRIRLKIEK